MTYAAWFELHDDAEILRRPLALRVYARLIRRPGIFFQPQSVKVQALALEVHAFRGDVAAALDLLTRRGFLAEHGKDAHGVRSLTVLQVRQQAV